MARAKTRENSGVFDNSPFGTARALGDATQLKGA